MIDIEKVTDYPVSVKKVLSVITETGTNEEAEAILSIGPYEKARKHGYWIRVDNTKCRCSECDIIHMIAQYPHGEINYCPNCGTVMEGIGEPKNAGTKETIKKYRVVTLCGSTRFKNEFMEAQKRLTLEGNIVISVGLFGHSGDNEVWENMDEGTLTKTKEMLDDMHKRKIDMADEIFVINVGGYIGTSTRSEIEYAKETGKSIRYLEPTKED